MESPSSTGHVATGAIPSPMLLFQADFRGTLAAARCVGARGVPVTIADGHVLALARWSRHVTRRIDAPDTVDPDRLLAWLLDFGKREPGHVLYPTSDDFAWLFALHRDALAQNFRLFSPPVECLERLLDKRQLHAAARDAGIDVPATWYPEDEEAAARLAPELPYPVLLKPRTQVFSSTHSKGIRVDRAEGLVAGFRACRGQLRHAPALLARVPGVDRPMVQAYEAARSDAIFTVSGFIDRSGQHVAARASSKILQRPRGLGVGLCFEAAPLAAAFEARLARLCVATGYYGAFDVEFLDVGERRLLIDFNPRFYNQMAFEIDRGVPVPYLAYLGAIRDEAALTAAISTARSRPHASDAVYCDRVAVKHDLLWQLLFRTVPLAEERRWRTWYRAHSAHATDPVAVADDRAPVLAAVASEIMSALRHPRAFVHKTALGRSH